MIIHRAYKTELDPNNTQVTRFLKHAGCARFTYNWGLARVKDQITKPNAMTLNRELNAVKHSEFPWMSEVSKCATQCALQDLQRAFDNFFQSRAKFPSFKSKRDSARSFRLTGAVKVENNRIQLPRLGKIRLKEHGYIPTNAHILCATVSEQAGRWFVSVLIREEVEEQECVYDTLGIDLGLKALATCSDGTVYENPKAIHKYEKRIKRLQKKMDRQNPSSKRRALTKAKIACTWLKVSNVRKDAIHKATTDIVKTKRCQTVVLEDLNIRGMVRNGRLAKSILDACMRQFRTTLEYKQGWAGGNVTVADRWFPSSKTCSECGTVKAKLKLSTRTFACDNCGFVADRDYNASVNLKKYTVSSTGINGRGDAKVHRLAIA